MIRICLALAALVPIADERPPSPEAARARMVAQEFDRAFREGDHAARLRAVESAAQVADAALVERLARAAREKEPELARAALEGLRYSPHPESVKALNELARREARLQRDPDLGFVLWRAIGQHGDATSIDVLADDLWSSTAAPVLQARVLALGRVRATASVERLCAAMKSAGATKVEPWMDTFRVALLVLTGVDQGASSEAWLRWWATERARFQVTAQPAPLPKSLQYAWDAYWGEARGKERPTRRADRGRDDARRP